ncbi:response regulator [Labrys miyagiensis]|uniref:Response regulator n=1 Tax=Labrys miyagiensis TaxID=346912 RepID=A0ABQ6CJS0_9HYPH|nr:response regulator [Labrys miyagiensis]GLS18522.1 response regulator [Labrys miyagiensis]
MAFSSTQALVDIVDDDRDVLGSLRFLLEAEGFEVRSFSSGADCLACPLDKSPDCFVIDYKLEGMNGLELVRCLRLAGQCAPIVLITGYPDETIPAKALLDGVRHVVLKPHVEESLIAHVRSAIVEGALKRP